MPIGDSTRILIKITIAAAILYLCYKMGQWMIPFALAIILAYAFHVPSVKMQKVLRISSSLSAAIIVVCLMTCIVLFTIFLIPLIKNAAIILMLKLPDFLRELPDYINKFLHDFVARFGIDRTFDVNDSFNEYLSKEYISKFIINLPSHMLNFVTTGVTLVYIITFVFMTPVITYYLLKDWEKLEISFTNLLKRITSESCIEILRPVNTKLGLYVRGQLIVCTLLSCVYIIGLLCIGVNRYVVCGIISGLLSIVPFFGSFLALLTTLATSLDCFAHNYQYALVTLLYLVIPFVDSNFITPKFIGKSTGIQPVCLLFSICACVSVLGTIGIFISVPMAVILSTVCKEIAKKI